MFVEINDKKIDIIDSEFNPPFDFISIEKLPMSKWFDMIVICPGEISPDGIKFFYQEEDSDEIIRSYDIGVIIDIEEKNGDISVIVRTQSCKLRYYSKFVFTSKKEEHMKLYNSLHDMFIINEEKNKEDKYGVAVFQNINTFEKIAILYDNFYYQKYLNGNLKLQYSQQKDDSWIGAKIIGFYFNERDAMRALL